MADQNTADVKLQLLGEDGVEYEEMDPLYLHSQVLTKSGFYEAMLSDRWSSDKKQLPIEIKVRSSYCGDNYIKCLELMYSSKRLWFSSVDEALAILPVACEILFSDAIEKCMQYLDAVPWSPTQEEKIRSLISSLHITILPHLAARLDISKRCNSDMLTENLQEMLSMTKNSPRYCGRDSSIYSTLEKCIVDTIIANPSSDIAEICRTDMLTQFTDHNLEYIKRSSKEPRRNDVACFVLLWLVDVAQRCDHKMFQTFLDMFCMDADLSGSLSFSEQKTIYNIWTKTAPNPCRACQWWTKTVHRATMTLQSATFTSSSI